MSRIKKPMIPTPPAMRDALAALGSVEAQAACMQVSVKTVQRYQRVLPQQLAPFLACPVVLRALLVYAEQDATHAVSHEGGVL